MDTPELMAGHRDNCTGSSHISPGPFTGRVGEAILTPGDAGLPWQKEGSGRIRLIQLVRYDVE